MTIADALKVNSSLTTLYLGCNEIQQEGTMTIADALKVNSSLTYLAIVANLIRSEGAAALADALLENTGMTSLHFQYNQINRKGAASIARALTYNPTLVDLKVYDDHSVELSGVQEFKTTFSCLQDLLKNLIGRDGAQILGTTFQIKSRCVMNPSLLD